MIVRHGIWYSLGRNVRSTTLVCVVLFAARVSSMKFHTLYTKLLLLKVYTMVLIWEVNKAN